VDLKAPIAVLAATAREATKAGELGWTTVTVKIGEATVRVSLPGLDQRVGDRRAGAVVNGPTNADDPWYIL
jgi:hypothetical protein